MFKIIKRIHFLKLILDILQSNMQIQINQEVVYCACSYKMIT